MRETMNYLQFTNYNELQSYEIILKKYIVNKIVYLTLNVIRILVVYYVINIFK